MQRDAYLHNWASAYMHLNWPCFLYHRLCSKERGGCGSEASQMVVRMLKTACRQIYTRHLSDTDLHSKGQYHTCFQEHPPVCSLKGLYRHSEGSMQRVTCHATVAAGCNAWTLCANTLLVSQAECQQELAAGKEACVATALLLLIAAG